MVLTLNRLHEIHLHCHQRLQFYQVPPVSLTLRLDYSTVSPWQGILFGLFSTEVGATQGWITGAQITINSALSALFSQVPTEHASRRQFLVDALLHWHFPLAERRPSGILIAVPSDWRHSSRGASYWKSAVAVLASAHSLRHCLLTSPVH